MVVGLVRRLIPLALVALLLGTIASAVTATNTVPSSKAGSATDTITLNKLAPASCRALGVTFTSLVKGSGTITGTNANDLILGSATNDDIDGKGGTNCCMGGGGTNKFKNCDATG